MAAEWYYAKNKQKVGPVTEEQLQELLRSGELALADMVWKQGMAKWQPAGTVDGLLPKSPPDQSAPPPLPDTTSPLTNAWLERFKRNKPAYLSALFAVALLLTCICGPIMDFVLGVFPQGLRAILGFLYFLFMVGLFIALVVAGIIALVGWSTRAERETNLWGKWEPVSGEGCSLWFYQDGGFLRNDGFGAKYVFDPHKDIITINVEGFGKTIPLKVITITEHELIVDGGNQALHFKKGKTITDERWEASAEKTREFLKQAALVTGAVAVGVVAVSALVLGAAAIAAGGMAGASAGGSYIGPGTGGPQYRQVPCPYCFQTGWVEGNLGTPKTVCDRCGGKGYKLEM